MPIQAPQLDDLRFDRTVEELVRRIPVYAPEWTDHNDSDPGITMIQLVAYLAEQVGYRLNRIPEKNHVELLKLLGIRLEPATAARTRLALLLQSPIAVTGRRIAAGLRARAKTGDPPPVFEGDTAFDLVPAQPSALIATKNPLLYDLTWIDASSREPTPLPSTDTLFRVLWDGKTPKPEELPLKPVPIRKLPDHRYLWIGVDYNKAPNAGFLGVRVALTIQLDDDEQPDVTKAVHCELPQPQGEAAPVVDYLAYYDAAVGAMRSVPPRIDDTSERLTRSGSLCFTVPFDLGPIPDADWKNLQDASPTTPLDACLALGRRIDAGLAPLGTSPLDAKTYRTVLTTAVDASAAVSTAPAVPHPIDAALRTRARDWGWLRLDLDAVPQAKLRIASFNVVAASNALTVENEIIGRGDGRPGQSYLLANRNLLPGTLSIAMQESSDPAETLVDWQEIPSLDTAGPLDSVYELDAEAGAVQFGDGGQNAETGARGGRIPPLVPQQGEIVALTYRWGGGKAGEVATGTVTSLETAIAGVDKVVNVVPARGGRDAETLAHAKLRARKELSTRSRAVTADDFEWIALRTPGVRVARAHVVPLRRPLDPGGVSPAPPAAACGPPLPAAPSGLDTRVVPGAVTVVVIPDDDGPEPTPTPSFLRSVCEQLDGHRLVTTEVYVVPPQFCRVCQVRVSVRAEPGYSRAQLQTLVEQRLGGYLHALRGGPDGKGYPFGAHVHIAELMAEVFRTEGVARVESVSAEFTRTKSNGVPRQGRLVLCPAGADEFDRVDLGPEETVSVDVTTLTLATVA